MTTHVRHRDDVYQVLHDGWDIKHIIVYRNFSDSEGERLTLARLHPSVLDVINRTLTKRLHAPPTSSNPQPALPSCHSDR